MPQTFQTCQPNDLRYNLDWRWQLARQPSPLPRRLRRKAVGTSAPATGDQWIAPTRDYMRGRRRVPYCTGIDGAIRLRDEGQSVLRSKVEALLLTSMPFPDIATRCGLPEHTVEAFHALFFDVLDRLHDYAWINAHVLGREPDGKCHDFEDGAIWRRVGYDQGVVMLDVYMAVMLDQAFPQEFVSRFGSKPKLRTKYARDRIKLWIAQQRATTHDARAALARDEANLRKLHMKIFRDESPDECALRVMCEMLRLSAKPVKTDMR